MKQDSFWYPSYFGFLAILNAYIILYVKLFRNYFNNPLASLINCKFLLSHMEHFDISINLSFFVLATFGFLCIVSTPQTIWSHCFINKLKSSLNLIKSLIFWFLLSFHYILLAHYLFKQVRHELITVSIKAV